MKRKKQKLHIGAREMNVRGGGETSPGAGASADSGSPPARGRVLDAVPPVFPELSYPIEDDGQDASAFIRRAAAVLSDPTTLIYVDTSFLMWLTKGGRESRAQFLTWADALGDRVHVPVWTYHEYYRHHTRNTMRSALAVEATRLLDAASRYATLAKDYADDPFKAGFTVDAFDRQLEQMVNIVKDVTETGKAWDYIGATKHISGWMSRRLCRSKVVFDLMDRLGGVGPTRYTQDIPPGFRDRTKKDSPKLGSNKFGDLILWEEVLAHLAKSGAKNVVVLTRDRKEDWFAPSGAPKIGTELRNMRASQKWNPVPAPHPTLVIELRERTPAQDLTLLDSLYFGAALHELGRSDLERLIAYSLDIRSTAYANFVNSLAREGKEAPKRPDGELPPETVLDLTHESLIRNWQHLTAWASAEAADVRIAESFVQQAGRWQANGESAGFVLPIGLYTFFAQWHRAKKGAASWLAYYLEPGPDTALRQEQAATQNATLTRFLKASRRRLWFSLLVARYGAGRLAGAAAAAVLIMVLAWVACLHRQQQSDYVAYRIVQQCLTPQGGGSDSISALQSPYVAVEDKGHFLLTTDRLQSFIYQPVFGGRPAGDYAFPRVLSALRNDTLALDIELSMYACANNMDRDSIERENPYIQPILRDLVLRLDSAGHRRQPPVAGRAAAPSEKQRREAVLLARTIMALSYYLASDQQHRTATPPDTARRAATRHYFAARRVQLLRQLRNYLWREINTTTGPAPRPVAIGFCLRVLLGQGTDSTAALAFLDGLSPFGPPAARQQFDRFFPLSPTPYAGISKATHSGGYLTAAMLFAARRQPALVQQCLDSMNRLRPRVIDVNSGIALLPYLVKYKLLKPATVRPLLEACARVGGFSFNEMYAATVYSLLSVKPVPAIFEESLPTGPGDAGKPAGARLGGFDPGTQNSDRVSFALPVATRDSAWAALQGATRDIAINQTIFIESEEHDLANSIKEDYYDRRNQLFLTAFLAKMHGVYLAEIKRRPAEAAQSFAAFSGQLVALRAHLLNTPTPRTTAPQIRRNAHQINTLQWNLGGPQQLPPTTGTTRFSTGAQSPVTFLRLPTRPKTLAFETYYTCSFNTFFHYELQREATARVPDPAVVQLLDSVAFVEAALPDRLSTTRVNSLFAEALARPKRHLPNLAWIRAVARTRVALPHDSLRRQRNGLLLSIQEALRDHGQLNDTLAISRLIKAAKQAPGPAGFSTIPLKVAFSDLAAAVAHEGRLKQAFALANALGEPMTTITKIRACEQAMLTDNRSDEAQFALMDFLPQYFINKAGTSEIRFFGRHEGKPQPVAGSVVPLFYWHPFKFDLLHWFVPDAGRILNNQLSTGEGTADAGLYAICKGNSLADEGGQALGQIPSYEPAHFRQIDYNYILLGIAHLNDRRNSPSLRAHDRNGWREYDEAELTLPADYDGPVD